MEGSLRSGGIVKKKSSSGCLIIKKKDGVGGVGLGSSGSVKKRPRLVPSDSESSEELLEPIGRRGGEKFHNERVGSVKSGAESREFGRNGKIETSVERKRSKLDLFDFDEYDEFDEEKKWNVARTTGSSSREFASAGSSRNVMPEKRKHSNIDSSSSLPGSRAKDGDEYGVQNTFDLDDDEAHMPISLLRLKYQEPPQEPIRLQGKNGVLKVMVNKKKKMDLPHKDYDLESKKGSRSEGVVKKDLMGRASFHSDSKRPEKRPLSIKTELKSQKPSLAKGVKFVDDEMDVTDTLLKLAPPNSHPVSSKTREIKEESMSLAAEDVAPAKSKEGKLKRRGNMEKQQLQPASSKTRVIKDESRVVEAEDVTPAKSKEGKLKRGGSTEKQQLREKIRGMLIEAGWTIDYRPRRNRDYLDAVYINPSGTAYWSIIKAYDALQKQSGEDSGKSKLDGGSSSFAPLSDDLINKLTRRTRKKIEKEMKRKRKDDAKNRESKKSTLGESEEDTDGEQHEEKLSSYVKKKSKLLKGKSHATDQESDGDTSGNSLKGERLKQDMSGKSSVGAASSAMQGRKSRILGRCTLLVRRSDKEQDSESDGYVAYTGKRTLLAWMIDSGTVKLSQKVQYMNRRRTRVKLEGWITRDGIHCGCCSKILPVSKFELHAGSTLRQPFQNIIVDSGVSLLECLVDAWNRQEESERQDFHTVNVDPDDPDDDTCGICGDGGDLICCDGCPSTFHQSCLGIQMLPQGDWHCPNCSCKLCGTASTTAEDGEGAIDGLLKCSLCEKKYHKSCSLDINALPASSSNPSVSFCGRKCQELYDHLQKILGVKHEIEAGFTWSLIQRTDLDSDRSHHAFPQRVECNSKLAVALAVMDECFLPIVDRKSGINILHNVLYNCGSNYSRLNFSGFYTAILERGDEIISAASIRIHGTQLAEMPYIGTRNIYRRQGMCRRLLSAIETVLSNLEVEKLIIPAISEHMHTWTVVFGFNPLEESEKLKMKSINMLVFPGTDMLQKRLLNGEIPKVAGIDDGDSKHSNPQLPDLVERADQESLTRFDGNLHDEACGKKVDGADSMDSDSPATTAIDLRDSDMDRAQSVNRESDIQISSKDARSVQSDVEKKLAGSTAKLMPSSPSDANIGNADSGDAAVNVTSTEVDAQLSEPVHQDLCKENAQTTCSIIDINMSDEASARNMNSEKQDEEVLNTTSTDAIDKDFSADTTKLVPSSPSGSTIGNTVSGNASFGPSSEVDARSSEPVHQNVCKEDAQTTCSVFGIDLSYEASTRSMKSEKQDDEVPNTTSTDANGKDFSADTTNLMLSSPYGASIGNTDSGDATLGPSSEVDAQSSELVLQNVCKENSQTACSVFGIESLIEASAGNMEAKKQDEEVPNTSSADANGKDFSADTTKLIPSYPSGVSIGNTDSGDTALGCSTEVDAQPSEPVHQNSQTTCSVFDIDSSDEASAGNMEAKKQNEVSNTVSTVANREELSADTTDNCSLEPAAQSAVEIDKKKVSENVCATYASAEPAISLNADSTRPSKPDVQNGLLHGALKQTSDTERICDANVSLEEGNLDDPPIGGVVNDDNSAEVPSSRPAIDSSSETSLSAAPEENSDYRLDSSPSSQACSSGLKPSDGNSAAKIALSEKIVHSEPSQAESHEVTVMDQCGGTVQTSSDDSAQLAAEEKIQT